MPIKVEVERRPPHPVFARPIARDKTNFESKHWQQAFEMIDQSRFLIVLCSEKSAKSEPVNNEVKHFLKKREAGSALVPVLLSGKPNCGTEEECYCPALRGIADEDFQERSHPSMIPDAGDPEMEGWENGFIALAAHMLGLERQAIGDHVRREEARKKRINQGIMIGFGVLALLAVSAAFLAYTYALEAELQRENAVAALAETEKALYFNRIALANAELAQGRHAQARRILASISAPARNWEWHHLWLRADSSLHTDVGADGLVSAVALSPQAKLQAEANADASITLRDAVSHQIIATLSGHETEQQPRSIPGEGGNRITALIFDGSGARLASLSSYGQVRIWDMETKKQGAPSLSVAALAGGGMAFNEDGTGLVLCHADHAISEIDWRSGQAASKPIAAPGLQRLALSRKGKIQAWVDAESRVHVNFGSSPDKIFQAEPGFAVTALSVSEIGPCIAAGYENGQVVVWRYEQLTPAWQARAHNGHVSALAFFNNDRDVLSSGDDLALRRFNITDGAAGGELFGHEAQVTSILPLASGVVMTTSLDGTVKWWAFGNGEASVPVGRSWSEVSSVAFGGYGEKVIASVGEQRAGTYRENWFQVLDLSTGKDSIQPAALDRTTMPFALSEDGKQLAYATSGGECGIVALGERKERVKIETEGLPRHALGFTGDGGWLAGAGAGTTVTFWDSATGKSGGQGSAHESEIRALATAGAGRIASGGDDGRIIVWTPPDAKPERILSAGPAPIFAIACSRDGEVIVAGDGEGTLQIWGAGQSESARSRRAEGGPIVSIDVNPTGDRFLTVSEDGTVRLWDTHTGIEVLAWRDPKMRMRSAAFGLEGKVFVAGGDGGPLRLWRIADADEVSVRPAGVAKRESGRKPAANDASKPGESQRSKDSAQATPPDWNEVLAANEALRKLEIVGAFSAMKKRKDEPHDVMLMRLIEGKQVTPLLGESLLAALNAYHESRTEEDADVSFRSHEQADAALAAAIEKHATLGDLPYLCWLAEQSSHMAVFGTREKLWWGFSSLLNDKTSAALLSYFKRELKNDPKAVLGLWCELLRHASITTRREVWLVGLRVFEAGGDPVILPTLVEAAARSGGMFDNAPVRDFPPVFRRIDPANRWIDAAIEQYRRAVSRYSLDTSREATSPQLERLLDLRKHILTQDGKR